MIKKTEDNKHICVYCGSKSGRGEVYYREAKLLGIAIALKGYGLIFGGGNVGLMGAVAEGTLEAGGSATGVIPHALAKRDLAHRELHELIVVKDMHERKAIMAQRADAFVALPGGYGTLEELFEVIAWLQLGFHTKPIGLLNTEGYYDDLIAFLDNAVQCQFLYIEHRSLLNVESKADELVNTMAALLDPEKKQ